VENILTQTVSEAEQSRRTLVDMRRRISNNEAIPEDELAAAMLKIRNCYGSEAKAKAKKTAKPKAAKAPKKNADDLLAGLLGDL